MNKRLLVLIGFFSLTFIAGCSIENTNNPSTVNTTISAVFDIPSLISKNVNDIISSFGPDFEKHISEPTRQQLNLGIDERDNTISKSGFDLLITYNPKTRELVDLFLSADRSIDNNKITLMKIGNLNDNSDSYYIEEVKALKDPSQITGIKILKK